MRSFFPIPGKCCSLAIINNVTFFCDRTFFSTIIAFRIVIMILLELFVFALPLLGKQCEQIIMRETIA